MALLSINLNKIALIRNARGTNKPDLIDICKRCIIYGVGGITVHPRPDERHVKYSDLIPLLETIKKMDINIEFNIEGYPSKKFCNIVNEIKPDQVTLVPDPPGALTSSFGWDCLKNKNLLKEVVTKFKSNNIMNKKKLAVCLIQIEGKETPELNLKILKKYLKKCLKFNPSIIFTPECLNVITSNKTHLKKVATTQKNCPVLLECMNFARKHNLFISVGSLLLKTNNSKKLVNRSFFINDKGRIINYYDKIHLFDVKINKNEIHHESKTFKKGKKIVFTNLPWGKFGLTICYDIRFPILYKKLVKLGCKFILVPAAFTIPTGKAHWKILLQSRAIENACYIIAAAQCGNHHGSRKTYGHSMIIDPWGKIILKGSTRPGIFSTTLDLELIRSVRTKIPSINQN